MGLAQIGGGRRTACYNGGMNTALEAGVRIWPGTLVYIAADGKVYPVLDPPPVEPDWKWNEARQCWEAKL